MAADTTGTRGTPCKILAPQQPHILPMFLNSAGTAFCSLFIAYFLAYAPAASGLRMASHLEHASGFPPVISAQAFEIHPLLTQPVLRK